MGAELAASVAWLDSTDSVKGMNLLRAGQRPDPAGPRSVSRPDDRAKNRGLPGSGLAGFPI